jgi:hypothetical protein
MEGFVVTLLVAVLLLVLFQFILDAVGLEAGARKIIWFVAVIVAVIYVLRGAL